MRITAHPTEGRIRSDRPNGVPVVFPSVVPARPYPKATVTVDFQHDRLADLVIRLEAPDGTRLPLLTRTGRGAHDGAMSFEVDLSDVQKQNGVWRVVVLDFQAGDGGLVREATIEFVEQQNFAIELSLKGLTPAQEDVFDQARTELESVIHGVSGADSWTVAIAGSGEPIDGPGAILGSAGPTRISTTALLPLNGIMQFDTADLAAMEADGSLASVIKHEMLHVLGIGTLWSYHGLVAGFDYRGSNAKREFEQLGKTGDVPVEDEGGQGTAGGHWDEDVFGRELMTGWLNAGINPLSRVTIGSLADMGYLVDYTKADAFGFAMAGLRAPGTGEKRPCRVFNRPNPEFT